MRHRLRCTKITAYESSRTLEYEIFTRTKISAITVFTKPQFFYIHKKALQCQRLIEHCCWGALSSALSIAQHLGVFQHLIKMGVLCTVALAGDQWYGSHESGATQAEIKP